MSKPIHVKPSLYAYFFLQLKELALKYGYNLVLHGSLNRDLDLIAIPWQEVVGEVDEMIKEMTEILGGEILDMGTRTTHHGRKWYTININRNRSYKEGVIGEDPQYYLDISVMPAIKKESIQ
jgi:hypothetical protein